MAYLRSVLFIFIFLVGLRELQSEESLKSSRQKKILVLIIASDNHPAYFELQKVWESYMQYDPEHVTAYFLKADPLLEEKCKIAGNTIFSKVIDGYTPGILLKTVYALELLEKELTDYDYVIRTNLSSVFDFPKLFAYLETLPKERCYAGRMLDHNWDKSNVYVQGCGIVFSTDVVQTMIKDKDYLVKEASHHPDDVLIGEVVRKNNIQIIQFAQYSFTSRDEWLKQKMNLPKEAFHFRVRNYFLLHNPHYFRDIACPYDEELFIAADMVRTIYPGVSLKKEYQSTYPLEIGLPTVYHYYAAFTSDINEHLTPIRELSRNCQSVVEIGEKNMCATWGLLQGMADRGEKGSYVGRFFETPHLQDLLLAQKLAKENKISFSYQHGNDRFFEMELADLLFIDALHTYVHLSYELEKFSPLVKKYIVIHDTSAPWGNQNDPSYKGDYTEYPLAIDRQKKGLWPAIEDFLQKHPEWVLKERLENNHGLTILERKGDSAQIISKNDAIAKKKEEKIIYFIQGHWGNFFDPQSELLMRQAGYDLTPMYELLSEAKKEGYDLRIASRDADGLIDISGKPIEPFKLIIVFDVFQNQLAYLGQYPKEKLVLFLWEPPSVSPQSYDKRNHAIFSKVYTWRDDYIDNKKYFKLCYPVLHPMISDSPEFKNKKLCALIASNRYSPHPNELYSARKKLAEFFQIYHPKDLDLYGRGWSNGVEKVYRGIAGDKVTLLKNYKFNIAYENIYDVPGYVTEKIFDAFQAGVIPVYWGASNIEEYIPKECFIARSDFSDNEALYQFMQGMSEEQYKQIIAQIQKFLGSEQAQKFSSTQFVRTTMDVIRN